MWWLYSTPEECGDCTPHLRSVVTVLHTVQKCMWQVTAEHTCALCMWLCMKWHGAWLYGVHRIHWDSSSFTRHQPCQCCKYAISVADIQKTCYKKLVTHVESRASAVSLLENREQCYIEVVSNNNYPVLHSSVVNIVCLGNWRSVSRLQPVAVFSSASSQCPDFSLWLCSAAPAPSVQTSACGCVQQRQLSVSCFEKPASCHCFWTSLCTNKIKSHLQSPELFLMLCVHKSAWLCLLERMIVFIRVHDCVYLHQQQFTEWALAATFANA